MMVLRRRVVVSILTLLVASVSLAAQGSPLIGSWTGQWIRGGEALPVTFHFEARPTGMAGSFDSDQLRVVGVPLTDIRFAPPSVEWKIVGDATTTTFHGELSGDEIAGTFDDAGTRGTFRLRRDVTPPPELEEREVTFRSGDAVLAGSVLLPRAAARKLPAIVFLHGSGAEGRWASKYLATRFARAGFAALIYDKRGVGKSTGDWKTAKLDDLVADAVAAISMLRAVPEVDAGRVGNHGHSQGGTLAPLVAVHAAPLSFVIASSAAGVSPEDAEIYSIENSVKVSQLPAAEAAQAREYIRTLVTTAYRGLPHQQLLELWQRYKEKPWAIEPAAEGSYYWSFSPQFARYEPLAQWRQVKAPVLLVYGEEDQRVPARASASAIAGALLAGGADSVSVRLFANADHTLRVKASGIWPGTPAGYPGLLVSWARAAAGVAVP